MRPPVLFAAVVAAVLAVPAAAGASPPSPLTQAADAITSTSVVVHGTISAAQKDDWYTFAYGTTTSYGRITAIGHPKTAPGAQPVSATVTGLTPATTYHVVLLAGDDKHTNMGGDVTFTTAAAAAPAGPPSSTPQLGAPSPAPGPSGDGATPAAGPPPQAVLGQTVVVRAAQGTVRVRAPGARAFDALASTADLPVGTLVDARAGTVALRAALPQGAQAATLRGAIFEVRQAAGGKGVTDIVLRGGDFGACRRGAGGARAAAVAKRRRPTRSLWAHDAGGRFRTRGRNSVATVRGTTWVTTDTCAGTRTTVKAGAVAVYDRRRRATVIVRAGHSYLARGVR